MAKPSKTQKCRDCGETKSVTEFYYHRTRGRYMERCSDCSQKRSVKYCRQKRDAGDYRFLLRTRASGIKRDCRARRGGDIEVCDDLADLLCELWEMQQGRCAYMDVPMSLGTGLFQKNDPDYCSVDRLDSTAGYTRGNVILCCCSVNKSKQAMSLRELFEFCQRMTDNKLEIEKRIKTFTK